ncbi:MAG: PLP-dependent aminotransferase family protein [Candidatus Obscuribacterales bacterium]|nr:PLP-dependent aminotransferase family protein [Candidatus Obscuribacterales bacterium]
MDFPILLDSQSDTSLHRQLYDELRKSILSGRLNPGQRVPSTRALSDSLGISRATVTMAYDFLLSEGYLQSTIGSGTYVCRQLPDTLLRPATAKSTAKKQLESLTASKKAQLKKLSKYGSYLKERNWLGYGDQEPDIQFSFGRPDLSAFPMRQWMQIANQVAKKQDLRLLDCPSKSQGYLPLRQSIAAHLAKSRAVNCTADQIIIVNGSQQAIDLVTRVLVERGDSVAIEEPGYIGAKKAFEVQGAQLIGIPVDESGLVVDRLKMPQLPNFKLAYVTPSHQFPTGVVLTLPRRLELLAWAQQTGTFIIEDDYDSEFRYEGRPVPALAGLDQSESVIYIGTFSKVLFPALRLGYLVVPQAFAEVFARAKWLADRHSSLMDQMILAEFIKGGHLERHIRRMRMLYEHRRKTVISVLQEEFADTIEILGDNAGINVLVRFKKHVIDDSVTTQVRSYGVGLSKTSQFYLTDLPRNEVLLNYGSLTDEEIAKGVKTLAAVLKSKAGTG